MELQDAANMKFIPRVKPQDFLFFNPGTGCFISDYRCNVTIKK
jgi:hypothetical protein